jgi:hypothetical protein
MKEALENAIREYANLSGMTTREVAIKCLEEGPVHDSVMMLLFSQASV